MDKERAEHVRNAARRGVCLGCGEQKPGPYVRGQCNACYQATRRAINRGALSEKQLLREGLILPRRISGRRPTNPISRLARGEA